MSTRCVLLDRYQSGDWAKVTFQLTGAPAASVIRSGPGPNRPRSGNGGGEGGCPMPKDASQREVRCLLLLQRGGRGLSKN